MPPVLIQCHPASAANAHQELEHNNSGDSSEVPPTTVIIAGDSEPPAESRDYDGPLPRVVVQETSSSRSSEAACARKLCIWCCCAFGAHFSRRTHDVNQDLAEVIEEDTSGQKKRIEDNICKTLRCPVTLAIFESPYLAQDGRTYEHDVVKYLTQSPLDRSRMNPGVAVENQELHRFLHWILGNKGHCEKQEGLQEITDLYEWAQSHVGITRTNNLVLYQLCEAVLEFQALVRDVSILREHLKALAKEEIRAVVEQSAGRARRISAIRKAAVSCPSLTTRKCILEAWICLPCFCTHKCCEANPN